MTTSYQWAECSALIDRLCMMSESECFRQPVRETEAPEYLDIIKNPMDLSTIKGRLEQHYYVDLQAFYVDLRTIWSNCLHYNRADSTIVETAQMLSQLCRQEYKKIFRRKCPTRKYRKEQKLIAPIFSGLRRENKDTTRSCSAISSNGEKITDKKQPKPKWFKGDAAVQQSIKNKMKPNGKYEHLTIKEACYLALMQAAEPLNSVDIAHVCITKRRWLKTTGATPQNSIHAQLKQEINNLGKASPFLLDSPGRFWLWRRRSSKYRLENLSPSSSSSSSLPCLASSSAALSVNTILPPSLPPVSQPTPIVKDILTPFEREHGMILFANSKLKFIPKDAEHKWLCFKRSTLPGAGLGLFLKDGVRIDKDTIFCEYRGEVHELNERSANCFRPYVVQSFARESLNSITNGCEAIASPLPLASPFTASSNSPLNSEPSSCQTFPLDSQSSEQLSQKPNDDNEAQTELMKSNSFSTNDLSTVANDTTSHSFPSTLQSQPLSNALEDERAESAPAFPTNSLTSDTIISVTGPRVTTTSAITPISTLVGTRETVIGVNGIDGENNILSMAPLANDAGPVFGNTLYVDFVEVPGRVFLQATKEITGGQEIFVVYGCSYWNLKRYPTSWLDLPKWGNLAKFAQIKSSGGTKVKLSLQATLAEKETSHPRTTKDQNPAIKMEDGEVATENASSSGLIQGSHLAFAQEAEEVNDSAADDYYGEHCGSRCAICNTPLPRRVLGIHQYYCQLDHPKASLVKSEPTKVGEENESNEQRKINLNLEPEIIARRPLVTTATVPSGSGHSPHLSALENGENEIGVGEKRKLNCSHSNLSNDDETISMCDRKSSSKKRKRPLRTSTSSSSSSFPSSQGSMSLDLLDGKRRSESICPPLVMPLSEECRSGDASSTDSTDSLTSEGSSKGSALAPPITIPSYKHGATTLS